MNIEIHDLSQIQSENLEIKLKTKKKDNIQKKQKSFF